MTCSKGKTIGVDATLKQSNCDRSCAATISAATKSF